MRRRRAVWLLGGIAAAAILAARHGSARLPAPAGDGGKVAAARIETILLRMPVLNQIVWNVRREPLADLWADHRADGRAMIASGSSLLVSLPCAGSVTLAPRAGLAGQVLVSSRDGAAPDGLGLQLLSGSTITLSGGCHGSAPDLVVQAPASMPLTLVQSGSGDVRIGAFTGPMHLRQDGGADVSIEQAGSLDGEMSGSGDLSVAQLNGKLEMAQRGGGDLTVKRIQAAAVSLDAEGSGDVSISSGTIGHLVATMHGSGDLSVGAEIGDASVQAGEGSDVTLPRVRGRLERNGITELAPPG